MTPVWVYSGDRDLWELAEHERVTGAVEGATVRQWEPGRLAAWLRARGLPPLPGAAT